MPLLSITSRVKNYKEAAMPDDLWVQLVVRGEHFDKQVVNVHGPAVNGASIIEAMGLGPADEFIVLQHLPSGELADVLPDRNVDLTASPAEVFVMRGSETFSFVVDGKSMRWPRK